MFSATVVTLLRKICSGTPKCVLVRSEFREDEMRLSRYTQLLKRLSSDTLLKQNLRTPLLLAFESLLSNIPTFSLEARKQIITFARIDETYDAQSPYFRNIKSFFTRKQFEDLLLFNSPVLRCFLLFCARNAPITEEQLEVQKKEAFEKELKALYELQEEPQIDFSVLYSGNINDQLVEELPSNPNSSRVVNEAILRWIRKVSNLGLIYPSLSSKSLSLETTEICRTKNYLGNNGVGVRGISEVDLERIYHIYRDQIESNNEMRMVYYPAQFGLRVYYASGGKAFRLTKYIKPVITTLCDELVPSNKNTRDDPTRLYLEEDEYALCYDFTSFTTRLRAQTRMIRGLQDASHGVYVRVMDASDGPITVPLIALLRDLEEAHTQPEINVREYILGKIVDTLVNLNAGLLGNRGNITLGITTHASIGLYLIPTTVNNPNEKINTPGDDGLIITTDDGEVYVLVGLKLLGSFQMTKIYRTVFSGCLHLKRTIRQGQGRLWLAENAHFLSFEYERKDKHLDIRYEKRLSRMTRGERKKAAASSVKSFLKSLQKVDITDEDRVFLHVLFDVYYRWFGLSYTGCVPQFEIYNPESYFCVCCPNFLYDYKRCPIEYTINHQNTEVSKVPRRAPIEKITDLRYVNQGHVFQSNGSKLLTYMEKLGYFRKEMVYDYVLDDTVYARTIKEYKERHEYTVYTYYTLKKPYYRFIYEDYMV